MSQSERMGIFVVLTVLLIAAPAAAEESAPDFGDKLFSYYETDENDAVQSLNRVSGQIDRGYAPAGNTYKSENHYKPGPFGRQDATSSGESENST